MNRGFTLIELMIAVAIIGILSAIAYPSYQQYVIRGKRTEGRNALMDIAAKQERYYSDNNDYGSLAELGIVGAGVTTFPSENGHYNITITAGGADSQSFALQATPSGFTDSDCGNLTLTNAGVKGASAGSVADCWGR